MIDIKLKVAYDAQGKRRGVMLDPEDFEKVINEIEEYRDTIEISQLTKKDREVATPIKSKKVQENK